MRRRRTKMEIQMEKAKKEIINKILDLKPDYVKKVMSPKKYLKFTEQELLKHLCRLKQENKNGRN